MEEILPKQKPRTVLDGAGDPGKKHQCLLAVGIQLVSRKA